MFIRLLFIATALIVGGTIIYSSMVAGVGCAGLAVALPLLLGAIALMHPFYPKSFKGWIDRAEAKILPKSETTITCTALAVICWVYSWMHYVSESTEAPKGRLRFIMEPIYNAMGNNGIAVMSLCFGLFFFCIGVIAKNKNQ